MLLVHLYLLIKGCQWFPSPNMTDPMSVSAGIVALVGYVLQASESLYYTVIGIYSNSKIIRKLKQELQDLNEVLAALYKYDKIHKQESLDLRQLLYYCGKVSTEFYLRLMDCVNSSNGSPSSFQD